MPLEGLNHYTIRPVDLARRETSTSNCSGWRRLPPPLGFEGTGCIAGRADRAPDRVREQREVGLAGARGGATGLLDHIAFSCSGPRRCATGCRRAETFEERVIPRDRQTQLFLHDPDGVAVELNYPPSETAPA